MISSSQLLLLYGIYIPMKASSLSSAIKIRIITGISVQISLIVLSNG